MADTYSAIYFHLCSWNILLNLSKFSSKLNVLHTLATISEGSQIELFYTPLEDTQCTLHHLSLSLIYYSKMSLPQCALWCHSHSNSQSNLHILIILSMLISTTETTINTMRKRIIWKTQIQCIGIWQTVPSPRWTAILCSNIRTLLYSKTKGLSSWNLPCKGNGHPHISCAEIAQACRNWVLLRPGPISAIQAPFDNSGQECPWILFQSVLPIAAWHSCQEHTPYQNYETWHSILPHGPLFFAETDMVILKLNCRLAERRGRGWQ